MTFDYYARTDKPSFTDGSTSIGTTYYYAVKAVAVRGRVRRRSCRCRPCSCDRRHPCSCLYSLSRRRRCGSCNLFPCRSVQLRPHRNDVPLRVSLYSHLRRIWRMFLFQCRSRCRSALLSSPRRHSCGTGRRHTLFLPLGTDGKTPLCCTRYTGCVLQNRCHRRENTHSFSGLSLCPMYSLNL